MPVDPADFAEIVKGNSEFTKRRPDTKTKRLVDVWMHSRMSRVQSGEKRQDGDEPRGGVQKKESQRHWRKSATKC